MVVCLLALSLISENSQSRNDHRHPVKLKEPTKEELQEQVKLSVITNFILDNNPKLNEKVAEKYAKKIIIESKKRDVSPYIQAALIKSESDFTASAKHDISDVIGMSGIYYSVWKDDLKKEGIVTCRDDLKNPYKNIEASSYVLSTYMEASKTPREALARYKGYCALGKKQGNRVMDIALTLKRQEKQYS